MPRTHGSAWGRSSGTIRRLGAGLAIALAVVIAAAPTPAAALTWTRVEDVPASTVFSLQHYGTTLYAGSADIVYIGTGEGTNWAATPPVDSAAAVIQTVLPVGGDLWAGTFRRGVFRSTNGGASWDPVNTGLAGLGAEDVVQLVEKSDHLYAATGGAGVFVLDLAAPTQWSDFNDGLPVSIAGTVNALVLHGTTLIAPAGPNGFVYRFPEGATAWQEVAIVPPIEPGLQATDLLSAGNDLLVGTSNQAYRSEDDGLTWTFAANGIARGTAVFIAWDGSVFFAGVDFLGSNFRLYRSADRGDSWQPLDETLGVFLYAIEVAGDKLFAARSDGLWWTPLAATAAKRASWGGLKGGFRH